MAVVAASSGGNRGFDGQFVGGWCPRRASFHPEAPGQSRDCRHHAENLAGHEVVFLALPHGPAPGLPASSGQMCWSSMLELTSGWRDAGLECFHGTEHAGTWPYGLPEPPGCRDALRDTRRIMRCPVTPTVAVTSGFTLQWGWPIRRPSDRRGSPHLGRWQERKPHLLGSEVMGSASGVWGRRVHRHTPRDRPEPRHGHQ